MVDVQEGTLGALEEDVVAALAGMVELEDGVSDIRLEVIAGRAVGGMDFLEGEGLGPEGRGECVTVQAVALLCRAATGSSST